MLIYAASFYSVSPTQTLRITEFTMCRDVTNNGTNSIFIPTNTQAEWDSFKSYPPGSVTTACCDGSKACP